MISKNAPVSVFVFSMTVGLVTFVSVPPASATDIVVIRGNRSEVVSTEASAGVTVIRGLSSPQRRDQAQTDLPPTRGRPLPPPAGGAIATGGDNLWSVDASGRVRACWLQGTGYVNSLKIVCTR